MGSCHAFEKWLILKAKTNHNRVEKGLCRLKSFSGLPKLAWTEMKSLETPKKMNALWSDVTINSKIVFANCNMTFFLIWNSKISNFVPMGTPKHNASPIITIRRLLFQIVTWLFNVEILFYLILFPLHSPAVGTFWFVIYIMGSLIASVAMSEQKILYWNGAFVNL